ncbi:hypothetical protein VZG28_05630 [Synechococcus elongatus IITB4]|uniref:hypothetical protein n=1 Tax=Synechococcus elongatus TaxID=32046 RepID=UPI0030D36A7E
MAYRILHCGKSLQNYRLCVEHQVAGFTTRGPEPGDVICLAVNSRKQTLCGLRAKLGQPTDQKPWDDSDRYVATYQLIEVEYAAPFDLRLLADYGGRYWPLKFLQLAKAIQDEAAIQALNKAFDQHRSVQLIDFDESLSEEALGTDDSSSDISEQELQQVLQEVPDAKVKVTGTFQTVRFKNETDALRGLEVLVSENFYQLFPRYQPTHSLLIPENRLFLAAGVEARGEKPIKGIRSIPDALLIIYSGLAQQPFTIALIEYECFGESKTRSQDKSSYLNGQIIPQLMRFAAAFSIVTDKQIRDQTIKTWVNKIIGYIYAKPDYIQLVSGWFKQLYPDLPDQLVGREIDQALTLAFQQAIQVVLVIDDLSNEQKDTISNVIQSFKLETGNSIQFIAYIVRLEQRIRLLDAETEYALSVQ